MSFEEYLQKYDIKNKPDELLKPVYKNVNKYVKRMERKEKCLDSIILEQTGGCLCDPGFDFNGFIESESTGCD